MYASQVLGAPQLHSNTFIWCSFGATNPHTPLGEIVVDNLRANNKGALLGVDGFGRYAQVALSNQYLAPPSAPNTIHTTLQAAPCVKQVLGPPPAAQQPRRHSKSSASIFPALRPSFQTVRVAPCLSLASVCPVYSQYWVATHELNQSRPVGFLLQERFQNSTGLRSVRCCTVSNMGGGSGPSSWRYKKSHLEQKQKSTHLYTEPCYRLFRQCFQLLA